VEPLHVGLPVFEAFLVPVIQERHVALQLVQVDFTNVLLDAFLLQLVHGVLPLYLHRLVHLELLEAFQVVLKVHRLLGRFDLS
jgi:hypothetical protein